ncbi:MAG: hypothetical protein P4M14_05425 [Gammaproteobacteria bacterium]|nr:hypothetical protein [Gammaproteobacteria bacterium]
MKTLTSKMSHIQALSQKTISAMFQLYNSYYDGTNETIFQQDLAGKNWVILLYDTKETLRGFSTLAFFDHQYMDKTYRILYSGDTIVEHQFWGQHELAAAWIRFAGKIKVEQPSVPLYWLLIVKGYRTYRYLSAFCREYYPNPTEHRPPVIKGLMDQLALARFGSAYNPATGVVSFNESHGHLRGCWSDVPANVLSRVEVQYFLHRNPHYERGDELVCLCELSETNLKPYAKRLFVSSVTPIKEKAHAGN